VFQKLCDKNSQHGLHWLLVPSFAFCWPCITQWFLVNGQRDAQIPFYVFIFIFNSLHVSSTSCSTSGERNCINTTSGNCHSVLVAVSCAGWEYNLSLLMMSTMRLKHVES